MLQKLLSWSFALACIFLLGSCVEIIDDLKLNEDGSGTWKLRINCSESAVKINSILALDSLNGYRVPSKDDLRVRSSRFRFVIAQQKGIKSAAFTEDLEHYIWTLNVDFETLEELEKAITFALEDQNVKGINLPENGFVRMKNKEISKQFPFDLSKLNEKIKQEDRSKLFEGKYISILRFNLAISSISNPRYAISKNQMATMAQFKLGECIQNSRIINNIITLK